MTIRRMLESENIHIVRLCSSKRCKTSIHGHSYKIEILLESKYLDNAGMVYDFGLLKNGMKQIVDSSDHVITPFKDDDEAYLKEMQEYSSHWVLLSANASVENFCHVFSVLVDALLKGTKMQSSEKGVKLQSIIIHETRMGYAQGSREDAYSEFLSKISLEDTEFSKMTKAGWNDENSYEKSCGTYTFINPKELQ